MIERGAEGYPSAAKLLKQYSLFADKNRGQNFLDDANIIRNILSPFNLSASSKVLEIGPGLGHTSFQILSSGASLTALEIDQRFAPILRKLEERFPQFELIFKDAREVNWQQFLEGEQAYIVGNLPYNLSTELFTKALLEGFSAKAMLFLLQKEVSQKFAAKAGSKQYGPMSVLAKIYGEVSLGPRVAKGSFYPAPKIESQVIYLQKSQEYDLSTRNLYDFYDLLQNSFAFRRKTLANNIQSYLSNLPEGLNSSDILTKLSDDGKISLKVRPEEMEAHMFYKLFCLLKQIGCYDYRGE